MNACEFCEPGCRRKSVNTINKAFRISIRRQVGGSSQPVMEYDVKHNFTRFIGRFRHMTWKDKTELKSVVEQLKMVNTH